MIRLIDIRLNAAHPELPLAEAVTYTGAPSTMLIRGVPPNCGRWAITVVYVAATFPDGSTSTRTAVQSANGVWVATLPATNTSGRTVQGVRIMADGVDENGELVTGYILGVADFAVASLGVAPAPEPGATSYQMLYFDAVQSVLRKGDVAKIDGVLSIYNGTTWEPFSDLSDYYTAEQVDEAIDKLAAYYITADAAGTPFATHAALVNAQTYYSGGATRTPTRNDYAIVSADETHGGAEWRYIYAVDTQGVGQWEPQYAVEGVIAYDDAVTRTSGNGVKSSGIWSAIWGALSALPTGFSSLYDWCASQLAGKVPTSRKVNGKALSADVTLTGADIAVSGTDTTKISAALADKADESALPYEIKSVPIVSQLRLPASAFPVTWNATGYHGPGSISQNDQYAITGDSSSPWYLYNSDGDNIASFDRATLAYLEPGYLVEGLFFNGNAPVVGASPVLEQVYSGTLYDRTVNKVALQAGTSAFSLTLPTQNDGRSRDFLLRIDNTATGAVDATATVVDATLVDAAGMAIASLAAPAGKATAYRLTETANGTASPSANPEFVVRGANTEQEIAGKANRASPSTAGNIAALDANGNPTDSGIKASDKLDATSAAPTYSATASYSVGEVVTYYGKRYKCNTAIASGGEAWTAAHWTEETVQTALADKAPLNSPVFTGTPEITTTPAAGDNSHKIADTAFVKGVVPYNLVTKTIDNNGVVILDDRAINAVEVDSALSTLTIACPAAMSGKARDFGLRLTISAGVTAPELSLNSGETGAFETSDGEIPVIADGGTDGSTNILYFTETADNVFLVKGETLTAISQA